MAPWPEQGNELKSIDKVNEIRSSSFDENQHPCKTDHLEEKGKSGKLDESQDPQVLGLDEGQLKALLDEAITYKNPKDREGKSELFKELLQEVEADETTDTSSSGGKNPIHSTASSVRFNRAHRRHQQTGSGGRHISERNRSGGSLQNLVAAYANELEAASGCRGRRGAGGRNNLRGSNNNVSARQREGGSLPSNVNHVQGVSGASSSLFDEYKRTRTIISSPEDKVSPESGLCTDYSSSTNTHSRKTSSTWGDEEGIEMEEIRSGAGRTYTSRATLELCTGGTGTVPSGNDDNMTANNMTNTSSTDVDASILFPLKSKCSPTQDDSQSQHITLPHSPLQLSTSLNSTRCILNSTPTPNESSSNSAINSKSESSNGNMVSTLSIPPQRISIGSASEDRLTQQTAEFLINSPQVSMLLSTREYHTLTPIPHALHLSDLFSEPLHAFSSSGYISSSGDKCKSGYDENGNALNQADRKKQRRHNKMKNEKNTYLAETVDGFRGNSKLSELLLFIENEPGNKNKKQKQQQLAAQQHHSSAASKKNKTKDDSEQPKKRKGKEKLTKCNSLEEISKTKLEDLTSTYNTNHRLRPKKQVTLDDEELGWHDRVEDESNSVSADETTSTVSRNKQHHHHHRRASKDHSDRDSTISVEQYRDASSGRGGREYGGSRDRGDETEFRLVQTKKHRRRKRRSSHNEQIIQADVFRTARSSPDRTHHHRASSMPPSDRSDCSDLDSVHSLPITTPSHGLPSSGARLGATAGSVSASSSSYVSAGSPTSCCEEMNNNNNIAETKHKEKSGGVGRRGGSGHGRSNSTSSCHFAPTSSGGKLKAASYHSSSVSVDGSQPSPSLTQSTPNSTLNLARAVTSPELKGKVYKSNAVDTQSSTTSQSGVEQTSHVPNNSSSQQSTSNNKEIGPATTLNDESVAAALVGSNNVHNNNNNNNSGSHVSKTDDNHHVGRTELSNSRKTESNKRMLSDKTSNVRSECKTELNVRTSETSIGSNQQHHLISRSDKSPPQRTENNIAFEEDYSSRNGHHHPAVAESYETVTLPLAKHRAPSPTTSSRGQPVPPSASTKASSSCDVFVEFSLPPPPSSSQPPCVDVTVEKTVIIKSPHCTGISESVSLVIPPTPTPTSTHTQTNIIHHGSKKSTRQKGGGDVASLKSNSLPAVILLNSGRKRADTAVSSDLTFGFEINTELLNKGGSMPDSVNQLAQPVSVAVTPRVHNPTTPSTPSWRNTSFNYVDIVNYVGNAWKDVIKELSAQKASSNRIQYYIPPTSAS